jgi:DNA-binding NarL/FixJ family response regulator
MVDMKPRPPGTLLLVEPQFLFRRAVAGVARELQLAEIHETSNFDDAAALVSRQHVDAIILDLDDYEPAVALIKRVRDGESRCLRTIPVAVLAATCSAVMVAELRALDVRRIVLKPFKVKLVLECIEALFRPVAASSAGAAPSRNEGIAAGAAPS